MKFAICYYNEVLEIISFPSRHDAIVYVGARYGGQVGMFVHQI